MRREITRFEIMENWKNIFRDRFPKGRLGRTAESSHEVEIPEGEGSLVQFFGNAGPGVEKGEDAIYARCGEVFDEP